MSLKQSPEQQKDGRVQALSPVSIKTASAIDAVLKPLVRYYLRRRTAKVRMPEPKSKAAAGRSIAGPPLVGSPVPDVFFRGPVLSMPLEVLIVLCAIAAGASTNSARRAAVAKIIILLFTEFLLLSTYSIFYAACVPPLPRSYP